MQNLHTDPPDTTVPARLGACRKSRTGMSEEKVKKLPGELLRITATGPSTIWDFSKSIAYSIVTFIDDKLFAWTEPK